MCVWMQAPFQTGSYGDRWLRRPPRPCSSCSPAGALRRSLRVCSVAGVFLPACVCHGSVSLHSDRDWCCGPWWYQREERQQTEPGITWEHPPDNAEANRRHFVFYGFFNAGLIHPLTHCFLYCLIKNTLIFLTVHCGHSGRTLHCNQ